MKKKNNGIPIWLLVLVLIIVIVVAVCVIKNKGKTTSIKNEVNNRIVAENMGGQKSEEFVEEMENGIKVNNSEKISTKEINLDGLKINGLQLTCENSQTQLLGNVTNTKSSTIDTTLIKITLFDKEGSEIVVLDGIIKQLKSGESTQLNANASLDYSNAYDIKIEKSK